MKNNIICSTATFINKRNNYDHTLISKFSPELLYSGFEIFMFDYYADNPDEYDNVAETIIAAKNGGACFYTMHMTKKICSLLCSENDVKKGLELFESNCKYAVKFGVKLLVLHLWGGRSSVLQIENNIKLYPKLKEISDKYGLILTIENIVSNCSKPLDHMKRLWELYPNDIKFTIDVRQAEFHKSLMEICESSFLWENKLVLHIHIADFKGGYMDWNGIHDNVNISEGDVDFDYFFKFLKSIDFEGSIANESEPLTDKDDMVFKLNNIFGFIANNLNN